MEKIFNGGSVMNVVTDHSVFVDMLEQDIPFSFSRFNDGEMGAICKSMPMISRGAQVVTNELSDALSRAMEHEQLNYWKGVPCFLCYPELQKRAANIVGDSKYVCQATLLTNRHYAVWSNLLPTILKQKKPIYIHGASHNSANVARTFGIHFSGNVSVPDNNAWETVDSLRKLHIGFPKKSMVILCCGPISRVLIKDWFCERPDCTFLDMGSWFDPWARNVAHKYHNGHVPFCSECN